MWERLFGRKKTTTPVVPLGRQFAAIPKAGDRLGLTSAIYDKFHKDINQAITEFNTARTDDARKDALKKMQDAIQYVDLHTPPRTLATAQGFHDVKSSLFTQIKTAYAENGVASLSKVGTAPVAQILSDMSPAKADRLMEILHKGHTSTLQTELRGLYALTDTGAEATQWREFLRTHTIEFLGGGNSKNFKVTNTTDGSVKVLKVDNRLGMARHVEQHLRGALGDVFTPIDADRQVKGLTPKGIIESRTLLVTDLCTSGSVDEHSTKVRAQGQTATYQGASDIMSQMTQVFMDIQKANCMFPDSKLTNWLVDSSGKIRLADTKSFLFTEGGTYRRDIPGNESMGMLRTGGFTPSELDSPPYKAEKLHSSLLGRNIYAYLTGNWPDDYELTRLSEPIFKTPIGLEYKQLIQQLVQDPPSSRMSLADAQAKLQELGMKLDPEYNKLIVKARDLSATVSFDLKTFVDNTLKADSLKPGYSRSTSIAKIDTSLDQLKARSDKCDQLMKQISDIKIDGKSLVSPQELEIQKKAAMQGATSIDDLKGKLDVFERRLQQDMVKYAKVIEYQKLKGEIEKLKICDNDPGMKAYLEKCDQAILKGGKPDEALIKAQMEKMRAVKVGLELPENAAVKDIIKKYDKQKEEWFSRNMNAKARKIEGAMASIPIEERAKLLDSKHKGVTELLSALAWHRINPFAKPVSEGKIHVSSSANTFKDFKEKFKDKIAAREDVVLEQEHVAKPK